MELREEFNELRRQAREYLQYYSDLGLMHIGKATSPLAVEAPLTRQIERATDPTLSEPMPAPASITLPEATISEPPAAAIFTLLEFLPKQEVKMPKTNEPSGILSLFGDSSEALSETPAAKETLEDIRRDLGECQRCKLWTTRTKIVFGEGNPQAQLMFVGEAPGADEDASGRPFVGRAGQLLTKMIEAIQLKREDVYIANILKSRPPGNRNPEAEETRACIPFLYRQIVTISPRLIVTLGNPATQGLLETKTGISRLRGEFQNYPRIAGIKVLPTFHPAYLLRSPDKKRDAWEDLKKARAFLRDEI